MKRLACLALLLFPAWSTAGEQRRAMKIEDLYRFKRVATARQCLTRISVGGDDVLVPIHGKKHRRAGDVIRTDHNDPFMPVLVAK